ncbi:bifunctional protein PutA [Novosphingobium marinum]|uniref:Bifunctional protein PutA n=1 Tax=Novosphingobium marinum TaxID=1514948 RepID=A0A7Y9XZR7_9SPHN|nr:bifunctional proline dehydrogenase/L-glutamate gamma-semialdehyde dehydrogenase PutA [Novosphingobium marinum]NYH96103.1 RHH-type proline utilization regulon transcriptional repressor/proline dehydrogenase/delta 1-pyrroline-5-carboxylate dehydrogenase [Novosphingobium marinum]GGC32524.1 bifunctional protein PutA [Novosphingobium marinum]
MTSSTAWDRIDQNKFADEETVVAGLLDKVPLDPDERQQVCAEAVRLVERARQAGAHGGLVEGFLQEFSLGSAEGTALMCLAEALLRVPDSKTRDRLIAEKIGSANWASHLGQSESIFVNASTWGLMLTGRLVRHDEEAEEDTAGYVRRLAGQLGEPVIRRAVATAVRIMGEQFVLGRTIGDALARARREHIVCSFDMLGEGARTDGDAERYAKIYGDAIDAVGKASGASGPEAGHGVSVKLSALCPRYEAVHEERVFDELYPRLLTLAQKAAAHDLNLAIDAEEADRLTLSLKLLGRLAREESLDGWTGLGFVVQAYQKRGLEVIGALDDLARETGRRIMVRLVKGAYWDSEIKLSQVAGMPDYPVFTTKAATDVSYIVCAQALIDASPRLYPQFATHNAHTFEAVRFMARRAGVPIEHQRLHGMGESLYEGAQQLHGDLMVRTYAPVGGHEELLPYLVRRLLENGANSSFVHLLLDDEVPAEHVASDPVAELLAGPKRHPRIPRPADIYGAERANPPGLDWSQRAMREASLSAIGGLASQDLRAGPIIGGKLREGETTDIRNPADTRQKLGQVAAATPEHLDEAAALARKAQIKWDRKGGIERAVTLRAMADALEGARDRLLALLTLEGGKTGPDAVAEWREAIDFLRYYGRLAERQFAGLERLPGPAGERNFFRHMGRGTFACISPWNFPLAIFTGQIAAALAAGNAVIAKPAEQTPLIAAEAVRLFHKAGLDPNLLHLLPGEGTVIGSALVAHPGIDGVAFTGGTTTARVINLSLAGREGPILPFIAETGGLNGMFIDTSALREQVIDDVLHSAFGSAGQRCSALRVLFVPASKADALLEGLAGGLAARVVGDPALARTDIGPVIDGEALEALEAHVRRLEREARIVARHPVANDKGHFFAPTIAEIDAPDFLDKEVFGPILHVCRYRAGQLEETARRFAASGYGLTLGIHSRLEGFAKRIRNYVPAGNVYVNRTITGAVVGVQPFGGLGLSGTGPKAGGPNALLRYANEQAISRNIMAEGGDPALLKL